MQSSNHSGVVSSNAQGASIAGLNGRIAFPGSNGSGQQHTRGEPNFIFENVDPTNLDGDDDSDDELSPSVQFRGAGQGSGQPGTPSALKPGKKTKGRVKIKMEFIENKLRRYTTFSKRKTGIMKKAYELSTLTGTQVMLLVASETGHVYTFATRKLQPMITSDSGKALIQTCLNSPDPPPGTSGHTTLEQRMNPTGYEETELSYSVSDEDGKIVMDSMGDKPVIHMAPSPAPAAITPIMMQVPSAVRPSSQPATTISHPITTFTSQPIALAAQTSGASDSHKVTSIPIQFPGLILQTSGGQQVAIPASQLGVATSTQPQAIYRPATGTVITAASHTTSAESSTVCTPSFSFLSGSGGTTPSQIIMYQTPQGVVYAAPTPTTLGTERTIFNFQQPATAISIPHSDSGQIFTIPVSLANAQSILRLSAAPTGESVKAEAHAAPAKKARK